jgi:hypothetical protein
MLVENALQTTGDGILESELWLRSSVEMEINLSNESTAMDVIALVLNDLCMAADVYISY